MELSDETNLHPLSPDLPALANYLRSELENKKAILLYAYNGTCKDGLGGMTNEA